jgi:hypothetical protein
MDDFSRSSSIEIPESCEELQLLKVSVFLLSEQLSMNNRCTHITSREQALTPPGHRARAVFCQWLLAKYLVNTESEVSILFTADTGFTREVIVNLHNTRV